MKKAYLLFATAALLFIATGCEPVAGTSDTADSDIHAITSFSFKSIASTCEFIGPETEIQPESNRSAQDAATESQLNEEILIPEEWTIKLYVPQDTDVTCLTPVITFEGDSIFPAPMTVRDYSNPVTFTVTSEDSSKAARIYTVEVEQLATAVDWKFKENTFDQFSSQVTQLEPGEYRILFSAETVLTSQDIYLIRDALGKKENQKKLFRLDFTGCIFQDNALPRYAFTQPAKGRGITNLISVTLPEGLETIEAFAFEHDKNLFAVSLPKSLKSIGEEAFLGCTQLKSIRIRKGVDLLGAWVFGDFTKEQIIVMDVSEAPETWAPTWNYKCRAVIEWADPEKEPTADISESETEVVAPESEAEAITTEENGKSEIESVLKSEAAEPVDETESVASAEEPVADTEVTEAEVTETEEPAEDIQPETETAIIE